MFTTFISYDLNLPLHILQAVKLLQSLMCFDYHYYSRMSRDFANVFTFHLLPMSHGLVIKTNLL